MASWLGFESSVVEDETREIRRTWTEEEHRRRAGLTVDYSIPVYGCGGVYGEGTVEPLEIRMEQFAQAVLFGKVIGRHEPEAEGVESSDPAA